jgi:hypothetical protein
MVIGEKAFSSRRWLPENISSRVIKLFFDRAIFCPLMVIMLL